jgi:hypothetical protein
VSDKRKLKDQTVGNNADAEDAIPPSESKLAPNDSSLPDQQKQVLEVGPKNRVPLLNKIISDTY